VDAPRALLKKLSRGRMLELQLIAKKQRNIGMRKNEKRK
jgi:hypothetical protein